MKTLICNCNQTLPLDAAALRSALEKTPGASTDGLEFTHTLLCRREAAHFQRAAKDTTARGDELLVACTQESRLFLELNQETEGAASVQERPIHFVNIRETAGWSQEGRQATPKIAALLAAAQLPAAEPVSTVSYRSAGRCLVIGDAEAAERAAGMLSDKLDVSVLLTGTGGALAQTHARATHSGRLTRLRGWLGNFEVEWESSNPIDLDLCTRCNACVEVCPEGAIGLDYQVDLNACKKHRDCVRVCDAAGAIDFNRAPLSHAETYDLVLDLRASPAFSQHQPPQGYLHAGARRARAGRCGAQAARAHGRVRQAALLSLRRQDLRPQPQREDRLLGLHRRLLHQRHPQRRLAQGQDQGPDRRRRRRRPLPVRGLRGLLPRCARAAPCRLPTPAPSTRAGGCAPCWPPTGTPAAATRPC